MPSAPRSGDPSGRPTLFALASGRPPAGVAVIRLTGPASRFAVETMAGPVPPPRQAALRTIRDPRHGGVLDRGLVLYFAGPASFTGEDAAELQLHGGRAVVAAVLDALASLPGLRPAGPGDFTRRAFENGRIDLTEVEGLADLVAAETELQRRQAVRLADGAFARKAAEWRDALLRARAAIEADLDFSDEEDVPGSVADAAVHEARALAADIRTVLSGAARGERTRDGFRVVIAGLPNAGKSSLLNALAKRDAAIVTDVPGTTRDILDVALDLDGAAVLISDTAGLRDTGDVVEMEGVRRAGERVASADLVLWLSEAGDGPGDLVPRDVPTVTIRTKADLGGADRPGGESADGFPAAISIRTGEGLPELETALAKRAADGGGEPSIASRPRHRVILETMLTDLDEVRDDVPGEVRAEALRRAADGLGRLTGRIGVEEILGAIFSSFCIGK